MKRFLFAAVSAIGFMVMAPSALYAENYLHIKTSQGWEVLDLDKVNKLYFNNGVMTATDANDQAMVSYQQSDLQKMYVDNTTGIESIYESKTEGDPSFRYDSANSIVYMQTTGTLEIYNLGGELLVKIPEVLSGETVDLNGIAPGVIIIKSGNHTAKAIKK